MQGPLESLEKWDDFVGKRYDPNRKTEEFRDYRNTTPGVKEFYRLNHSLQTRDFVLEKKKQYGSLNKTKMGIWEALDYLNTLVDDSDPDTDLSQIEHNLQTAEAIRRDGHPEWFQVAGLVHDLGKVMWLWGEPQWAVVGDTFPTGCAYSDKIVFSEFFEANPDAKRPEYQTRAGVYEEGAGPGPGGYVLGTRRVFLSRRQGISAGAGAVHGSLPLVLFGASRRRVRLPDERSRPGDVRVGEEV